jgi:Putative transposase
MLNLNCHAHALVPDGVFAVNSDGSVLFHPLPPPWDDDVAKLLEQITRAIHRLITRYLAARGDDGPLDLLATEQAQAVAGLPARDRASIPKSTGRRSAFLDGYSLHADRLVDEADRDGLERLCRYGARSPVANSRLSLDPSGRVVLSFKRPLHDGRAELAFTPIDFLRRLATLIPPPFANLTHYHGVFAPNHHLRAAIVPAGAIAATGSSAQPRAVASTGPPF